MSHNMPVVSSDFGDEVSSFVFHRIIHLELT